MVEAAARRCPKCHSPDLRYTDQPEKAIGGELTIPVLVECDCGHSWMAKRPRNDDGY